MPVDDIIPSPIDPDCECVRIGSRAADGSVVSPPPDGETTPAGLPLCPDGYLPRRKSSGAYTVQGKMVTRPGQQPLPNPEPPPSLPKHIAEENSL
jgi:hypothetical protein